MIDPANCPLCGTPNHCQMCTAHTYKGLCWCTQVTVPSGLLANLPDELKDKACICKQCIESALREQHSKTPLTIKAGDFYFDSGLMVFTEAYHLRRGYCCNSGCRHCPFSPTDTVQVFP